MGTEMNGRTLVLVTGASRGFGRCVSEEFVRKVAPVNPITLVLIARSHAGLENAASAIEEVARGIPTASDVVVQQEALDLGDMDRLEGRLDDILAEIDPGRYSRAILVNNAGSLGHTAWATELPSLAALRSEMDFNVTSANWLSSRFAAVFGARKIDKSKISQGDDVPVLNTRDLSRNMVVNVSSLAALQEFEGWSGYCSGKAGRELFHRVLAAEQKTLGGLKVLNYAPGPMATDMSREIRSEETYEEEVRQGALIDPKVSAEKCVRLALCGRFATGAHVDFFDKEESG